MWKSQRDFHKEPVWRHMSTLGSKPLWNSQFTLSTDPAAWVRRPIGTMCMDYSSRQIAVPWPHRLVVLVPEPSQFHACRTNSLKPLTLPSRKSVPLVMGKHKLWHHSGPGWILGLPCFSYMIWSKWQSLGFITSYVKGIITPVLQNITKIKKIE